MRTNILLAHDSSKEEDNPLIEAGPPIEVAELLVAYLEQIGV